MEDPVYLADEHVLSRMLASETRQEMESYFESRLQKDFNESDRRALGEWMRDVCIAEECQPDIFPLSMLIVDRFLSFVRTKRSQLQLLGSVALLLASKLRQTTPISAKHLIYYTQDLVTLNELRTWEIFVLTTLRWDLALITPVDYLDIFIRRMKLANEQMISDIEDEALKMIVECCLGKVSLYPPSIIAWACLMRAMEAWQLTAEHLHLTTSVVAQQANNFMLANKAAIPISPPGLRTAMTKRQSPGAHHHHPYHHHHHHHHQHQHHHHQHHHQHHHHHNHHHHNHSLRSSPRLASPFDASPPHHLYDKTSYGSCGDSYAGTCCQEASAADKRSLKKTPGYQSMMPNGLNHFVLQANLAALDWN